MERNLFGPSAELLRSRTLDEQRYSLPREKTDFPVSKKENLSIDSSKGCLGRECTDKNIVC